MGTKQEIAADLRALATQVESIPDTVISYFGNEYVQMWSGLKGTIRQMLNSSDAFYMLYMKNPRTSRASRMERETIDNIRVMLLEYVLNEMDEAEHKLEVHK